MGMRMSTAFVQVVRELADYEARNSRLPATWAVDRYTYAEMRDDARWACPTAIDGSMRVRGVLIVERRWVAA